MSYSYFVARRLLKSHSHNRFVSFLTLFATAGLAIGTMALVITVSILNGFQKKITDNVSNFTSNIEIQGFERVPLPNYTDALNAISSESNVKSVSPFVEHEAMIRAYNAGAQTSPAGARSETEGILLKGILPEYDNSSLRDEIKSGKYQLSNAGTMNPLLLGSKLARRLSVHAGDTVFVFGVEGLPSPLNPPRVLSFVVNGIYETGMSDYDDIYGYTNIKAASYLFDLPREVCPGLT